ncbi:uncharacterized protein LOC132192519 isoform X2 [Neocloeon triangulifer]|uniref:uncharacterized protein LOC132192519 isoform X2 n=1 Tax=Neocloeon triangulifer TaxID=2078957 RepID=UPI00286EE184|nr:uncharacterized protein LOC132192519 isoform X2 [Neocloeon triangulifer]
MNRAARILALLCAICIFAEALNEEQEHTMEQTDNVETEGPPFMPENPKSETELDIPEKIEPIEPVESIKPPQVEQENLADILREVLKSNSEDSQAIIEAAVKSAASQIAAQVQDKMEQRLKRIETQAEENLLKYNGIAMYMAEKFYLKANNVERKIAKSLDLINEIIQYQMTKGENDSSSERNSSKKQMAMNTNFNCEGYKKLALMKVRYGKYYISENMTDWFGAKEFCETHGMELISFERVSEMRSIWQLADASKEFMVSYWTSASDIGYEREQFHWRNGDKIESELWITGTPDPVFLSNEHQPSCVSLFIGRLRATSCHYQRYFICEGLKHDNKAAAFNHKITGE